MDPAIVGGLITGMVGLLAAVISQTRCFMRVLPMDTGANYQMAGGLWCHRGQLCPQRLLHRDECWVTMKSSLLAKPNEQKGQ